MDQEAGRRPFYSYDKLVPCCLDSTYPRLCRCEGRVLLLTSIVELMEKGLARLGPEDGKLIGGGAAITQTSGRSKAKKHDAS